jgi:hypothetical protein
MPAKLHLEKLLIKDYMEVVPGWSHSNQNGFW